MQNQILDMLFLNCQETLREKHNLDISSKVLSRKHVLHSTFYNPFFQMFFSLSSFVQVIEGVQQRVA